jgi:RNA recognition motif-containing protein
MTSSLKLKSNNKSNDVPSACSSSNLNSSPNSDSNSEKSVQLNNNNNNNIMNSNGFHTNYSENHQPITSNTTSHSHHRHHSNNENIINSTNATTSTSSSSSTSLWIGNVDPNVTEEVLYSMFSAYGQLANVRCLPEKYCAFVNFKIKEEAFKAMQNLQVHLAIFIS